MSTNASSSKLIAICDTAQQHQTPILNSNRDQDGIQHSGLNSGRSSSAGNDYIRKILHIESQLELARKASDAVDTVEIMALQRKVRTLCKTLIMLDPSCAASNSVEAKLWKIGVYKILASYRTALLSSIRLSNFEEAEKINIKLSIFIQEAIGFYLSVVQNLYIIGAGYSTEDVMFFGLEAQLESIGDAEAFKNHPSAYELVQKIMINLGDLYRYQAIYCGNSVTTKAPNSSPTSEKALHASSWNAAFMIYHKVIALNPNSGITYNQLAVLHAYYAKILDSVYYYYRALTCKSSFHSARANFGLQLAELRKNIAKASHIAKIQNNPSLFDPSSKYFDNELFLAILQSEFINLVYSLSSDQESGALASLDIELFFSLLNTAISSKLIDSRKLLLFLVCLLSAVSLNVTETETIPTLKKRQPSSYAKAVDKNPQKQSKLLERSLNVALTLILALIDASQINKLKKINLSDFASKINAICFPSLVVGVLWLSALAKHFSISHKTNSLLLKSFQKVGLRQTLRKLLLSLTSIHTPHATINCRVSNLAVRKSGVDLSGWILPNGLPFDKVAADISCGFDSHRDLLYSLISVSNKIHPTIATGLQAKSTQKSSSFSTGASISLTSTASSDAELSLFPTVLLNLADDIRAILDAIEVSHKSPTAEFEIQYESILDNFSNFSSELKSNSEFFENNIDVTNCYQFAQQTDDIRYDMGEDSDSNGENDNASANDSVNANVNVNNYAYGNERGRECWRGRGRSFVNNETTSSDYITDNEKETTVGIGIGIEITNSDASNNGNVLMNDKPSVKPTNNLLEFSPPEKATYVSNAHDSAPTGSLNVGAGNALKQKANIEPQNFGFKGSIDNHIHVYNDDDDDDEDWDEEDEEILFRGKC